MYRFIHILESGDRYSLEMSFENTDEIAEALKLHWSLGLNSGVVIANPVPKNEALPDHLVEEWIKEAITSANSQGISGKPLTPFLLKEIANLSEKRSIKANLALIEDNTKLASQIACNFART